MNVNNFAIRAALGIRENRAVAKQSAPQGALSPLQWNSPNQPIYSDYSDQDALYTVQRRNIYAYKCISTIANSLSGCPFRAGNAQSYEKDLGAPLAQLLGPAPGGPNPTMSANALWKYSIAQYLTIGKFAWLKEYDDFGRVVGLWPLQAQQLLPRPADRNAKGFSTGLSYFKNYRYGTPGTPGYVDVMKLEDVVYVYNHDWGNPLKPQSPLQAAGVTINIHTLIDMFDYSLLQNGGAPSGLIITPPFAQKEDRDAFRRQFQAQFGGVINAGKVQFGEREFEPGEDGSEPPDSVKWIPMGVTPRDAQLSVLRDQKVRDICVSFGVPLSLLMDSTLSKFQNSPTDRRNYWLETCSPLANDLEDKVNIQLATQLGPQTGWFDLTGVPELAKVPVLPDGTQAAPLEAAGAFTWNEWRAERGLPPKVEIVPEAPVIPISAPALPAARSDILDAIGKRRQHSFELRHPGPDHEHVPSGHATKNVLETVMTKQLKLLFSEQAKATQDRLKGRRSKRNIVDVFDQMYWENRTYEYLSPLLEAQGTEEQKIRSISKDITVETIGHLESALMLPVHADDPSRLISACADVFVGGPERAALMMNNALKAASIS